MSIGPDAPLTGLRVAITRSRDRAGALADALAAAGAEPVLVPLIDFETAPDAGALDAALARLAAGEYQWLVVSSITTVRALKQWCAGHSTTLAELVPAATKVATIGPSSRRILEAEGLAVELAPVDVQSADGLVALWPAGSGRVLLPHSNLAEPGLESGIASAGFDVDAVDAYVTVDYPAAEGRRLTAVLAPSAAWTVQPQNAPQSASSDPAEHILITPAEAAAEVRSGAINAVVAASSSAAQRIHALLAPLPASCQLIVIGQPTRAESVRLGMHVAETATHPTPAGIVDALVRARRNP
ncbi:uroporphyrinogen-III synthase [Arthrobacter sp. 35W]|uniref:uroporphyrinogen-III synthase n=1 Tax=Arthrobacter sp. 35W TaxID=1132441 RepID=UPI00047B3142|nr:uroporphyrinogen-III synthase [Arthrobacter sp. 35W]